ncbi:hypothetical protein GGS26DRAFT_271142 [Hypomontagnella submonticulosa]|nr:hypothetical protein GGS26DRAFT_271142 [Hypomontagnella submonticulosa]
MLLTTNMASHHGPVACQAIPSEPTTVIATSYSTDSQLRNSIISGSDKHCSLDSDLPDEGIYIIHKDRALQIAAPPCEKRKCCNTSLCRCDVACLSTGSPSLGYQSLKRRALTWAMSKPCQGCLFNWLRLYQAAEAAHRLGMQFLQHPRTLTWASLYDHQGFHHDAELAEQSVHSSNNGEHPKSIDPSGDSCPTRMFEWMKETWSDFVESECCKPGSITALPEDGDNGADESCTSSLSISSETSSSSDSDSDSGWDDTDVPYKPAASTSIPSEYDDTTSLRSGSEQPHPTVEYESSDEDDAPPPVIIPPKNMVIAQALRAPRGPRVHRPTGSGRDGAITVEYIEEIETPPPLRVKCFYGDLIVFEPDDLALPEDASHAKHQKTDATVSHAGSWCYPGHTVEGSHIQPSHIPQKLVLT